MQTLRSLAHPPSITHAKAQPITIIHPEPSMPQREGKCIATDDQVKDQKKLVKASSIVRPDPGEPIRVEFMINGKIVYLTKQEIQEYRDKEEEIKKAKEGARLNAISKTKVIKVVREEAKKLGIHPKEAITSKVGELFKNAQNAEHEVLKRQHIEKVRKSLELREHKYDSYICTVSNILKPKPITDIKIHPKTKPVVITVYRGANGRNFNVHKPFLFGTFEQAPSQTSGKKHKHIKLEPETRIPGFECNRALPKNVSFVNNMVIEGPEYEFFSTDEFGDQAFQRWNDIDKVGMEALVLYLVAASTVKSPENARFSMKLRKLIAEHPD
nr:hypothetical protein [Tanacetum cinerariifolium]